jgi:two-component system, LytTR family, response regulator
MIRTIIIDDEPLARSIVAEYLQHHKDIEVVAECSNGFEGVKQIQELKPDLIFLDIQMPKISGFEMLELLDPLPGVIFTTAFDEYAVKAFDASAVDYLLKPFSQERFDQALARWRKIQGNNPVTQEMIQNLRPADAEENRIVVRNGLQIHIIPTEEIFCIEAFDDYVKIFTAKDYFLKKKTITHLENTLPKNDFLRVHRSHIIRLSAILKIEQYEKGSHVAVLKNERQVPLSRQGYQRLREVLPW